MIIIKNTTYLLYLLRATLAKEDTAKLMHVIMRQWMYIRSMWLTI